ncbi:MAG: helix-turn-helix domain-containing protein [Flavobacteriaceae bacterium]|nr:helix-turn-helix domain-containing protein [Flavobacteriaceae bacterium]
MVNNEDFANRIKKLLSFYTITAAQMADKIGVQRSSISHLLSGRNKPSLDFVIKVIQAYDEVDLYWLLNGKGHFPKTNNEVKRSDTTPTRSRNVQSETNVSSQTALSKHMPLPSDGKKIEHIIIFYKDGSFKKYEAA